METQEKTSLFDQIGGMSAVNAAVNIFYFKVRNDERISHFFRWVDMEKQSQKLKTFLAYAFGAPLSYTGKSMADAHSHLLKEGLNDTHFNAVLEHLVATLQELNVPNELIAEAGKVAESTREAILGRLANV
jgi:hemoglobin